MVKRSFDLLVSLIGGTLLLPIILAVATSIYCFLGAPILFIQQRPGQSGVPFNMIKFRTMLNTKHDEYGASLADTDRLTSFGRFLRSTSLDELPELWNVVKGDMSLVGPRPLLMEYLPLYSARQGCRHLVRPGITGWAQVNGRNAITWEEKFALDVWYVDNQTFWLDIQILFLTLRKVLTRDGVNSSDSTTMPAFTGSPSTKQSEKSV